MFSALQGGHLMRIAAAMAPVSQQNSKRWQQQQRTSPLGVINISFISVTSLWALPGNGRMRPQGISWSAGVVKVSPFRGRR
jgi:hypothetical protein